MAATSLLCSSGDATIGGGVRGGGRLRGLGGGGRLDGDDVVRESEFGGRTEVVGVRVDCDSTWWKSEKGDVASGGLEKGSLAVSSGSEGTGLALAGLVGTRVSGKKSTLSREPPEVFLVPPTEELFVRFFFQRRLV